MKEQVKHYQKMPLTQNFQNVKCLTYGGHLLKCVMHARFPALISVGSADRFLEDLGPDITRDRYFEIVVEQIIVQHVKLGWFMVFPDLQDHLGQVQGH